MPCFQTNKKRRSVEVTICLFKALQATKHRLNAERSNSGQSLPIAPVGSMELLSPGLHQHLAW